jgi:hypothetical protein
MNSLPLTFLFVSKLLERSTIQVGIGYYEVYHSSTRMRVTPDNGVLTLFLRSGSQEAYAIENPAEVYEWVRPHIRGSAVPSEAELLAHLYR